MYNKYITLLKFAFLSKYLASDPTLIAKCKEYCDYLGLGNPWLFGKFFMELLTYSHSRENSSQHFLDVSQIPPKLVDDYTFSRNGSVKKADKNISITFEIIPKPFYKLFEIYPMVLDYNYFQYAIDQGFFFNFYQKTSLKSSDRFKKYEDFKGYIGLHFFEQFLVKKYIEAIFYRVGQKVISTERYQDFIVKSAAKNILIFEVKMADLHANAIEKMDFAAFIDFIDNSFLSTKEVNGKNKGVSQVIKQVQHLAETNSELREMLDIKSADCMNIYPIIIYSDTNLDIGGVNRYVNTTFQNRIHELGLKAHFQSVKPLLMMNVNTLIECFALLKKSPLTLTDWINSYFKSVSGWEKRYSRENNAYVYFQLNRSFSAYMKSKLPPDVFDSNLRETRRSFDLDIVDFGKDLPNESNNLENER
ncbi:hypothetical protein SAMN04488511_11624 [Pedobacter suwonensis]|uniref:Uncharacterized protein n=1 Tax=Pedobacter suwonensis TaxID=332999 RepID=A0A1I0TXN1_9SPHI|nr:hypothetical protein [Pedobacter suwonensis]SFA56522.1 hypothetical protein SAMN04488511_11624 [Pedobacter suwonensis]